MSFVERGLRDPQLSTLVALASALDAATLGRTRVTVATPVQHIG